MNDTIYSCGQHAAPSFLDPLIVSEGSCVIGDRLWTYTIDGRGAERGRVRVGLRPRSVSVRR